jgi:hypothetical protein
MPVEEAPNDDEVRQSYNFAPGYHGLVYRAEGSDHGDQKNKDVEEKDQPKFEGQGVKYKLQSMQWGKSCKPLLGRHGSDCISRSCTILDKA